MPLERSLDLVSAPEGDVFVGETPPPLTQGQNSSLIDEDTGDMPLERLLDFVIAPENNVVAGETPPPQTQAAEKAPLEAPAHDSNTQKRRAYVKKKTASTVARESKSKRMFKIYILSYLAGGMWQKVVTCDKVFVITLALLITLNISIFERRFSIVPNEQQIKHFSKQDHLYCLQSLVMCVSKAGFRPTCVSLRTTRSSLNSSASTFIDRGRRIAALDELVVSQPPLKRIRFDSSMPDNEGKSLTGKCSFK